MSDHESFIRYAAHRDAERDHTAGICDPPRAFNGRIFDESCRRSYEMAYVDRHRSLDSGATILDRLRTAGLL